MYFQSTDVHLVTIKLNILTQYLSRVKTSSFDPTNTLIYLACVKATSCKFINIVKLPVLRAASDKTIVSLKINFPKCNTIMLEDICSILLIWKLLFSVFSQHCSQKINESKGVRCASAFKVFVPLLTYLFLMKKCYWK